MDRKEGSMQELGKKFKRTLAGNWWVGVVQLQGLQYDGTWA